MDTGFLGRGWSFPLAPGTDGDVAMAAAEEDVRQAILLILQTEPGERLMRPDFGSGLRSLVFSKIDTGTLALVRHRVEMALTAWEPRIDLRQVAVTSEEPGALLIRIDYRIRTTNVFYNLVFPYYLREGTP
ncbi:GPW/gp25 family protein [Streptomyces flaveus]|uniref:Baseplate protein n=1 Tax=Streptomyces flaveus TaxID=66370 RepID=A0A917REE6_9ACTN|nr:GPW/gp25 family protein [Streptomyces flaveus]GGL04260.1 baseplate protein [Streptomyces flaveus]